MEAIVLAERDAEGFGRADALWWQYNRWLAMFLLRQRRPARWGEAGAYAALRPRHSRL